MEQLYLVPDADEGVSHGFECNICLDSVQDPVVTLCGHLFCWPCIYKWIQYKSLSSQQQCQQEECRCPVCKAEVSHATLVPLYGKFQTTPPSKTKPPSNLGPAIPRRPLGPACGGEPPASPSAQLHHHHNYSQSHDDYIASSMLSSSSITTNIIHPVIGMFGDAVYTRTFGNTTTNLYTYPNSYGHVSNSSVRLRRHIMQADESLSRICFFLFCCLVLCLLLF
ncbi:E3 ubiquitin-protein ligase RMA1H1, partial [Cucurbita argyrosperma subsp. argyrosperma]